jgi:hypothetical protein
MASGLYKTQVESDITIKEPGLVKAWVTPIDDFTTLSIPTVSDPQVIGEEHSIVDDHEWQVGKEAIKMYADPDTMEAPGESNGDPGSLAMVWRPKVYVLGDGPIVLEIVENLMNARTVLLVQNACDTDPNYIQFGCACDPVRIEKVTNITGQKLAGGKIGYELTFRSFCKDFYYGAISERV